MQNKCLQWIQNNKEPLVWPLTCYLEQRFAKLVSGPQVGSGHHKKKDKKKKKIYRNADRLSASGWTIFWANIDYITNSNYKTATFSIYLHWRVGRKEHVSDVDLRDVFLLREHFENDVLCNKMCSCLCWHIFLVQPSLLRWNLSVRALEVKGKHIQGWKWAGTARNGVPLRHLAPERRTVMKRESASEKMP